MRVLSWLKEPGNLIPIIFLLFTIVALLILTLTGLLFGGSSDSARYLLSALAQTQGAIIAIVVSLTIVAVQVASQAYSLRITDLLLRSWLFWFLLLVYGVSITYDVILLNMLTNDNTITLAVFVNASIYLLTVALWLLFPYTKKTIQILSPERIVSSLAQDILKKKHVGFADEEEHELVPLFDIMKKTIKNEDIQTAKDAISQSGRICCSFINDKFAEQGEDLAVGHFCMEYQKVAELAFVQGDVDSAREICINLNFISNKIVQNKLSVTRASSLLAVMDELGDIGLQAIDKRWEGLVQQIAYYFANRIKYCVEWKSDVEYLKDDLLSSKRPATDVIDDTIKEMCRSLSKLNLQSMESDPVFAARTTKKPLIETLKTLAEKRVNSSIHQVILSESLLPLVNTISPPLDYDRLFPVVDILTHVGIVTIELAGQGPLENLVQQYLVHILTRWAPDRSQLILRLSPLAAATFSDEWLEIALTYIFNHINTTSNDDGAIWLIQSLEHIGVAYGRNRLTELTQKAIWHLSIIGSLTTFEGKHFTVKLPRESLDSIGRIIGINSDLDKKEIMKAIFRIVVATEDDETMQVASTIICGVRSRMYDHPYEDLKSSSVNEFLEEENIEIGTSSPKLVRLEQFLKFSEANYTRN